MCRFSVLIAARVAATGLSLLIFCVAPEDSRAQSQSGGALPRFELASVKPQPWTNEGGVDVYVRGNKLYGEHADLYRLVDFAYGLRPDDLQISGGPDWARHGVLSNVSGFDSALYQVVARAADGSPPSMEQFRLMLQALLAERFQLRVHHAMKDLTVFNLVVTKDGPKFREDTTDAKASMAMKDGPPFQMRAVHVPLKNLVEEPAFAVDRPVIDKTGLTGLYDFEIAWSPRFLRDEVGVAGAEEPARDTPSLFTALQRFGLKLESGTAPMTRW